MTRRVLIQDAFKLALSITLFYWLALWMNWDMPKYGALAIVLISLGTTGASLQKAAMRLVGTTAGLVVGMVGLALFSQDRWLTLLFLGSYLVFVSYFMQASRYGYAWFVAGFLGPLVWATTYGKVDNAFHYASFRYLETSAGIVIYTLVATLLWPRNAGSTLNRQGADLWDGLRKLLGMYRRQLEDGQLPPEAAALRSQVVGGTSKLLTTLQAAYADTPSVMAQKRTWEVQRLNVRAFGDALALWQESIGDCRRLDTDHTLPWLAPALDILDKRLARVGELWRARATGEDASDTDDRDGELLAPWEAEVNRTAGAALSHFNRAALLGFVQQMKVLDVTSRQLLATMRVLAGLDASLDPRDHSLPPDLFKPSPWDPGRLINALFPALCFAAAYIFWILFDPPTGPSVPNIASTFALLIVLTPMRAMALIPPLLISIWVCVAPVYFFIMPRLDSGAGLLTVIFSYAFLIGLLGARAPLFKTLALVMFVMMTGISNQQSYSFIGLVDGGMMLLLGLVIIGVVQLLLGPVRPEQTLLTNVRRFFRGCARITDELVTLQPKNLARGRALRKRYYESMVLPVPRRLQAVEKKIDYTLFPDNGPEKVQQLLDALQSIAVRLQALELAHTRLARRSAQWSEPMVQLGRQLRERVQQLFVKWSRFERVDAMDERDALQRLARSLEQELDAPANQAQSDRLDDHALTDLYTMLGCSRGLIQAVAEAQGAISRIDWDQWAEARF